MNNWNFNANNFKLFSELNYINSSVEIVLQEVYDRLYKYNASIIQFWIEESLKHKIESYLLRYSIPFYELMITENKKQITDALIVQLLSCVSWRTFDNCIDLHDTSNKAQANALIAALQLQEFSNHCTSKSNSSLLASHYKIMTEQSVLEKKMPVQLNDIWFRCSIFLFASELFCLNDDSTLFFKQYINYTGLAHDTHDYFSDISGKVISLPVFWMKELNPDDVFSVRTVEHLYEKIRQQVEPLEKSFKSNEVEKRFPLINHLLQESWKTFHHV